MKKFYVKGPEWCSSRLQFHWVGAHLGGILYAGVTVFGRSLLYSDEW